MQRVERIYPNVSPIMDEIDSLYAYLSAIPSVALIKPVYDESFRELISLFSEHVGNKWQVVYDKRDYSPIQPNINKNIILAFSGGKDSIASALRFRDEGYNVYLYHMRHINPSFADEWKCAQESANILGMPIFFDDIKFSGHHMYMEHPMKNMIIANGALSYGVREGITTTIAFGNYTTSYLDENVFERCGGDCEEMWEAYEAIIQRVLPDFRIQMNLDNMGDTLEELQDKKDLLNASLSCLCRHSLRDYRREWVQKKFGVALFSHRCGSCYKCCVEYIFMADHNKLPFNAEYYKYCLGQLYKVAQAEGVRINNLYDVWDNFIFYPVENSRLAEDIETAKLGSKIFWKNT